MGDLRLTPRLAGLLVEAATTAPSFRNTQPWCFLVRLDDSVIELYAEPGRVPPRTDPDGRAAHISCGAALFNLRLAVSCAGAEPVTRLLPDPGRAPAAGHGAAGLPAPPPGPRTRSVRRTAAAALRPGPPDRAAAAPVAPDCAGRGRGAGGHGAVPARRARPCSPPPPTAGRTGCGPGRRWNGSCCSPPSTASWPARCMKRWTSASPGRTGARPRRPASAAPPQDGLRAARPGHPPAAGRRGAADRGPAPDLAAAVADARCTAGASAPGPLAWSRDRATGRTSHSRPSRPPPGR